MEAPDTMRLPKLCKSCRGCGYTTIHSNGGYWIGNKFYHDPTQPTIYKKLDCPRCPITVIGGQNPAPNQPE